MKLNHELMAALNGKPILWVGDQESFDIVAKAQLMAAALTEIQIAAMQARVTARDENGMPMIWEKRGAVAVINVSGSLVDGNAGFMRYFGVTGYDDIAEAAVSAYSDPDVKKVMWKIESPGGQVSGVMDLGNLITQLSGMKGSMVYTSNQMASGGYWLGSSVKGEILAGATAEVGSIGVLTVLTDLTKALEDAGIKKTIMRAGEDKTRVNPFEPLTAEARAQLQQAMDDVHGLFRAQVSKGRPNMSTEDMLAATTGRTFLGKRAKSAGLVDKVASFEQALKLLDSQITTGNTPSNSKGATMKTVLTTEQIAKIAAGVPLDQLGLTAAEVLDVQAEQERQAAELKATADAAATAAALVQSNAAAAAAAVAAAAAGTPKTADALAVELHTSTITVGLLQSQLVTANATIVSKEAALVNLQASTQSMTATHDGMLAQLRTALGRLQIAMGGSDTTAAMDGAAATAAYASLSETFNTKFKIGQASKTAPETKPAVVTDANLLNFQRTAAAAQQNRTKSN